MVGRAVCGPWKSEAPGQLRMSRCLMLQRDRRGWRRSAAHRVILAAQLLLLVVHALSVSRCRPADCRSRTRLVVLPPLSPGCAGAGLTRQLRRWCACSRCRAIKASERAALLLGRPCLPIWPSSRRLWTATASTAALRARAATATSPASRA